MPRRIDSRLHIARRGIDIPRQIELHGDAGAAEVTGGGHLGDGRNPPELALQRRSDGRGHGFRTRSRQSSLDGDGWKFYLGNWGDGQEGVGDAAGQRERGGQQRGCDRSVNKRRRDTHEWGGPQ